MDKHESLLFKTFCYADLTDFMIWNRSLQKCNLCFAIHIDESYHPYDDMIHVGIIMFK